MLQTSFVVSDVDRSVAFYRDILGFELEKVVEAPAGQISDLLGEKGVRLKVALMWMGPHMLELMQYTPPGRPQAPKQRDVGAAHMAFTVEDIDAASQALKAKGVTFVAPPQDFGRTKAVYFRDPDGITMELLEGFTGVTGIRR